MLPLRISTYFHHEFPLFFLPLRKSQVNFPLEKLGLGAAICDRGALCPRQRSSRKEGEEKEKDLIWLLLPFGNGSDPSPLKKTRLSGYLSDESYTWWMGPSWKPFWVTLHGRVKELSIQPIRVKTKLQPSVCLGSGISHFLFFLVFNPYFLCDFVQCSVCCQNIPNSPFIIQRCWPMPMRNEPTYPARRIQPGGRKIATKLSENWSWNLGELFGQNCCSLAVNKTERQKVFWPLVAITHDTVRPRNVEHFAILIESIFSSSYDGTLGRRQEDFRKGITELILTPNQFWLLTC